MQVQGSSVKLFNEWKLGKKSENPALIFRVIDGTIQLAPFPDKIEAQLSWEDFVKILSKMDACWALNLKIPALIMIIPTMLVAMLITYQTRKITGELLHNLAINFWITANCTWMIGEFFGWDANLIGPYGLREFSVLPFGIGLLILGYYYLVYMHKPGLKNRFSNRQKRSSRKWKPKAATNLAKNAVLEVSLSP